MKQKMMIRQALTGAELESAKKIRERVFVDEQNIPAHLVEDSDNDSAIHVLLSENGQAMATARMFVGDNDEGIIARVAVLPACRGKGYGKLLVEELVSIASEMKIRRLSLKPHTYLEKFYARLGFAKIAGETEIVGEHLLITMEKYLSN
jgi:predicted GNAT family N-acyltransferase